MQRALVEDEPAFGMMKLACFCQLFTWLPVYVVCHTTSTTHQYHYQGISQAYPDKIPYMMVGLAGCGWLGWIKLAVSNTKSVLQLLYSVVYSPAHIGSAHAHAPKPRVATLNPPHTRIASPNYPLPPFLPVDPPHRCS